jgi:hypothetical protein
MGRRAVDGEFANFVERICRAKLSFGRLRVDYHSPSQGRLSFGWHGPLRQNDVPVPLDDYPRYDNTYTQAPFPASEITIRQANHWLQLNWLSAIRKASDYV